MTMPRPATPTPVLRNIRREMAAQSIGEEALAVAAGVPLHQLRRRLHGTSPLSVDDVVAIASALAVHPLALLDAPTSRPVNAGACPEWCDSKEATHAVDSSATCEGDIVRFHERAFGDHVSVCRDEVLAGGGATRLDVPHMLVTTEGLDMRPAQAEALLRSVTDAVRFLREVTDTSSR